MAYDEEEARKSRVVVETPNERREVVHSQSVRDNSGVSAGMVGVLVVVAIALITMLVLFWMSSQPATDNANVARNATDNGCAAACASTTTSGDHSATGARNAAGADRRDTAGRRALVDDAD